MNRESAYVCACHHARIMFSSFIYIALRYNFLELYMVMVYVLGAKD